MRNYKDMADAVFARRDEYVASVKRKKKIALNASLSLCAICLAVMGAFGIWKTGVLAPDPNVIGTKPQSYTEPTAGNTLHSLSSNATSEGEVSKNTEIISGNTKPQGTTGNTLSTEGDKPQSTDPAEKVTKPAVKPSVPTLRPTLPTLPIGPKPPIYTPDVPPTSGDDRYPQSQTPVVTDPVEDKPNNDSFGEPDIVTPTTDGSDSAGSDSDVGWPDEPMATEPCETQPPCEEPTTCSPTTAVATEPIAGLPETETPMNPAPPTEGAPDVPPTSVEVNRVEGKVLDQYGNPVKGAVVKVYYDGVVVGTYTTGSNGYYYIAKFRAPATIEVYSVPKGYTLSGLSVSISKGYNNIVLTCNKK